MKVGELYRCTWKRTWVLHLPESENWSNAVCLYLGKQIINRKDGQIVVNFRFLVDGKERVVDRTMLKYMEKIG
jgi:hypothetical protein